MRKKGIEFHDIVGHSLRNRLSTPERGLVLLIVFLAITLATSGCNIQIRAGRLPDVQALESSLQPGESTRFDVLRVLGEPFGRGREMLPIGQNPRTLWSYYYEEGSLQDDRRMFLFIFLDGDKYDGYMWFSSLLK
jgi:hypothetical protein